MSCTNICKLHKWEFNFTDDIWHFKFLSLSCFCHFKNKTTCNYHGFLLSDKVGIYNSLPNDFFLYYWKLGKVRKNFLLYWVNEKQWIVYDAGWYFLSNHPLFYIMYTFCISNKFIYEWGKDKIKKWQFYKCY